MTSKSNRKQIAILSFVLVVVMLGYGIVIPIIPFYVEHLGAGGSELGLLVASYALMRLICGPIWGGLSDRVGRKPVLLIGVLGYGITMVLFGLATELWMLFAARILSGILSSATAPTTMAYISDSTSEEDRGGGMGVLGAAVGLGTILGPGLGGLLAGDSLSLPFFIAGGLSFLALALAFLFLPESLPAHDRQQPEGGMGRLVDPGEMWRAIFSPIGSLLFMAFLVACGMTVFYGIFGLYALKKFGYGPQEVGTILMAIGLASAVAQGALTGPLTKRWGEALVIKGMLLLASCGFLVMLLADSYPTVLLTTGLFVLVTAVLGPAVTSLTSKRADMRQGIAMGLNNSFFSLGRIAGPLWGGVVFDLHVDYPYLSGAAIMFVGFLISLAWISQVDPKGLKNP